MHQLTFGDAEQQGKRKRTRREVFLAEMDRVVPWEELLAVIAPHYPRMGQRGRQPYPLETMLRIHLLQQWYALSDPSMEEALYEIAPLRQFARLSLLTDIPDETTILNFRHLLERNQLAEKLFSSVNTHLARYGKVVRSGTIVDATIISAPSSTKNSSGERDPEMHQTRKGKQWYFGMKAHIGVDVDSGLVHSVVGTAANVHDLTPVARLLHGAETHVHADAGYTGIERRDALQGIDVAWQVAMRPGQRRQLDRRTEVGRLLNAFERLKARTRARVEHPFRVIKQQFGYRKVRYRGLAKNTAQIITLFALSNLWMMRRSLLAAAGGLRL